MLAVPFSSRGGGHGDWVDEDLVCRISGTLAAWERRHDARSAGIWRWHGEPCLGVAILGTPASTVLDCLPGVEVQSSTPRMGQPDSLVAQPGREMNQLKYGVHRITFERGISSLPNPQLSGRSQTDSKHSHAPFSSF